MRRLDGDERAAASALAVLPAVYLLHALADIDWDFVAASAPVLVAVGVLLSAGRPPAEPRSRPLLALGAGCVALAVLYSITAPWISQRRVEDAYSAIARGDAGAARSAARQARDLVRFRSIRCGRGRSRRRRRERAGRSRATSTPRSCSPNSDTWFALGAYEFGLRRYRDAYLHLDRAYGLDPYGPAGLPGGLLDQARAKVEGR